MAAQSKLQRFVEAQEGVYPVVLDELKQGRKTTHWMWFIFPQIKGLGKSATAVYYALSGAGEAHAYLAHPLLGKRLLECAGVLLQLQGRSAETVFGEVDAMKLRSSMTLFAAVSSAGIFQQVLDKYYDGQADRATLALLETGEN